MASFVLPDKISFPLSPMPCNTATSSKAGEKHTQVEKNAYPFTSRLLHSIYSKHSYKVGADWSLTLKARRPISAPKTQYVSLSMLQETFQHGWHSISEAATEYI